MFNYFSLNKWQMFIILGIAISGIAAFINTYDALFKIDEKMAKCAESDALSHDIKIRFIVLLVVSCLAVALGIILAIVLTVLKKNPKWVLVFSLVIAGVLGVLYAVVTNYSKADTGVKLGISWASLIAFVILGFVVGRGAKISNDTEMDVIK